MEIPVHQKLFIPFLNIWTKQIFGVNTYLVSPQGTITEEKGSVSCTKCERGTYRSAAMTAPICEACPAGFFSGQQGLAACTPCATGTFSQGQAIECDKCGKGTFQKKEGQETCEECPPGYFSDTEGEGSS